MTGVISETKRGKRANRQYQLGWMAYERGDDGALANSRMMSFATLAQESGNVGALIRVIQHGI
jgi:hypothetical protein